MKCSNRIAAAISLLFIEVVSAICLDYVPRDDSYYIVCGAFNLLHIVILWLIGESLIIKDIKFLSLISLIIQLFGFISYHYRIPIALYNFAIYITVFLQILRLLIKRKGDTSAMGTIHPRLPNIFSHDYWRNKINFEGQK